MSTIRVAKRTRFTTIDRETIRDKRLSFRARGVLAWLLDHPDDWRARADVIASEGTEGRDAIRAALRELADHGYLLRSQWQDDKGRWQQEVVVHERPQCPVEPETDSQASVIQAPVFPSPDSQALYETTNTEEREAPKPPSAEEDWKPTDRDLEAGARTLQHLRARHGFVKRDEPIPQPSVSDSE